MLPKIQFRCSKYSESKGFGLRNSIVFRNGSIWGTYLAEITRTLLLKEHKRNSRAPILISDISI